jgi:hypothetical protein
MVLQLFIAWIALGVLAVLFMYCCSLVSNGPRREFEDDGFTPEPPSPARPAHSGDLTWADSYSA